jgi:hypothetical protein
MTSCRVLKSPCCCRKFPSCCYNPNAHHNKPCALHLSLTFSLPATTQRSPAVSSSEPWLALRYSTFTLCLYFYSTLRLTLLNPTTASRRCRFRPQMPPTSLARVTDTQIWIKDATQVIGPLLLDSPPHPPKYKYDLPFRADQDLGSLQREPTPQLYREVSFCLCKCFRPFLFALLMEGGRGTSGNPCPKHGRHSNHPDVYWVCQSTNQLCSEICEGVCASYYVHVGACV